MLLHAHCDTPTGSVSRVHRVSMAAPTIGVQNRFGGLWRKNLRQPAAKSWWHPSRGIPVPQPRVRATRIGNRTSCTGHPGDNRLILARAEATQGRRQTPRSDDDSFLAHSRLLPRTRPMHVLQTFLHPCEIPRAVQKQCPAVQGATKVPAIPQGRKGPRFPAVMRLALFVRSKWRVLLHQDSASRREQKGNAGGKPWFCEIRAIVS